MEDVFLKLSASARVPEWPAQYEEDGKEIRLLDYARQNGNGKLETIQEHSSVIEFDEVRQVGNIWVR